jgi:hypothetical protein
MSITFTKLDYFWLISIGILIIVFLIWLVARKIKKAEIDEDVLAKIKKEWQEVENLISENSANSWKLAILEADKVLDLALKILGFPGKDLGERLKVVTHKYPSISEVWAAHKVRNQLVHETDYQLNSSTAKKSVEQFRRALKILRML